MTIYDYAKSGAKEKMLLINDEAILIETFRDNENTIYVYRLFDFFVELTTNNGAVIENTPYKRGYKFDKKNIHALEKRNTLYSLAA